MNVRNLYSDPLEGKVSHQHRETVIIVSITLVLMVC